MSSTKMKIAFSGASLMRFLRDGTAMSAIGQSVRRLESSERRALT